ncbi:MAG TPA: hypothetical protein VEY89_12080 [Candidatus Dormibacteraeota bacterium]|nr:hypothetical protein [Candidatus Dormibacteraeota bacterium]
MSPRRGRRLPAASAPGAAALLSLKLVEGVRQRLELARLGIAQGHDPRPPLRAAMLRIRKLPVTLAPPADEGVVANLTDLSDYMCRRLRTVRDEAGVGTLDGMCDLLREIRRAWVTLPAAASTLRGGSARTAGT